MHKQLSLFQKARELPTKSVRVAAIPGETYFVQALIAAIGICVALYLYFVGLSIMNVIANREAYAESDRLQSIVSALEEDYFTLAKSVTVEMGNNRGLTPTQSALYVRRTTSVASVMPR